MKMRNRDPDRVMFRQAALFQLILSVAVLPTSQFLHAAVVPFSSAVFVVTLPVAVIRHFYRRVRDPSLVNVAGVGSFLVTA